MLRRNNRHSVKITQNQSKEKQSRFFNKTSKVLFPTTVQPSKNYRSSATLLPYGIFSDTKKMKVSIWKLIVTIFIKLLHPGFRMRHSTEKKDFGFTLIELLIVIAIVAILAAIAYPSYTEHLIKSNRAAAESHLMDIAQREQQYFMDNRGYASTVSALSITTPSDVASKYTITIALGSSPPTFTATASPIAGTIQASDGDLTIDNAGTKTPSSKW